eukprot:TRINITY_DN108731_c0_g1_i1.p1 TRINITY_DN108731_c0_g1~~TRINITY_DN108731_c0_g1_i1.p1  ORF type:complete len:119 (+),score=20.34 TRINITY_DN108731_c0_g1_i1:64-420(+)
MQNSQIYQLFSKFIDKLPKGMVSCVNAQYHKNIGYNKYGLLFDDLNVEDDVVTEAIRRLPLIEQERRWRRIKIASDLSIKNQYLPEDEWTTIEEDRLYLTPYIEQVIQENKDRVDFRL